MSEVLRCDRCGAIAHPPLVGDWYKVELLGLGSTLNEPDEYHFCSLECLRQWAKERQT